MLDSGIYWKQLSQEECSSWRMPTGCWEGTGVPGVTATQGMLRAGKGSPLEASALGAGQCLSPVPSFVLVLLGADPSIAHLGTALGWSRIQQRDQCLHGP